nr:type II toxin-antitoxin system RelE/ParE family toxin [uncultured Lachnoanaerobaculum sp.]
MELLFKSNIISVCNFEQYIITHGFTKKTQKTPVNEIKHAKVLKKEFEENNNG